MAMLIVLKEKFILFLINLGEETMMNIKKPIFGFKAGENPEFSADDLEDIEIKPKFKSFMNKLM